MKRITLKTSDSHTSNARTAVIGRRKVEPLLNVFDVNNVGHPVTQSQLQFATSAVSFHRLATGYRTMAGEQIYVYMATWHTALGKIATQLRMAHDNNVVHYAATVYFAQHELKKMIDSINFRLNRAQAHYRRGAVNGVYLPPNVRRTLSASLARR